MLVNQKSIAGAPISGLAGLSTEMDSKMWQLCFDVLSDARPSSDRRPTS